jgi:hypothetical protein
MMIAVLAVREEGRAGGARAPLEGEPSSGHYPVSPGTGRLTPPLSLA